MKPSLVVLAAGSGSRYGGLKQLAPVGAGGESLLEYSVYDALRAGFGRIVLVVRPETEPEFRRRFRGGMADRTEVAYAHQLLDAAATREKPWGTGHAVLAAAGLVEEPFAVVNADDFYGSGPFAAVRRFLVDPARGAGDAAVVGFAVSATLSDSGPVSRALCEVDKDDRLTEIVELPSVERRDGRIVATGTGGSRLLSGDALVSMNMWGFHPAVFALLKDRFRAFAATAESPETEFLLPEVVRDLMATEGLRVRVLRAGETWGGLTFPADRERVAAMLEGLVARGLYPRRLWG